MIETVLGPINPAELGVTMCHEHLALNLSVVRQDSESLLNESDPIVTELAKLRNLGCRSVVEVTGNDMGRRPELLVRYARASGLNLVASTGFYLYPYHTPWLLQADVAEVEDVFVHDLTQGMENTTVKAGLIAEIATGSECIRPSERKVFLAAAAAGKKTGAAVSTHCDLGRMGREQLELLLGAGLLPSKVILGHMDWLPDTDYHLELLKTGVNLAFDTIGKIQGPSDERRADCLVKLLEAGYEDHLVLSQDVSRRSYLTAAGGRGYTAVLGGFTQLLTERGVGAAQLEKLLVHNPARILNK